MPEIEAIKSEIKRLLQDGVVEVVMAFKPGDTPLHPQPAFFTTVDEVDNVVYNGLCQNNLATFLTRIPKEKKVAMLVRGCENRSVNALIVENQKSRDDLFLIGIPCEGIIDWRKIVERVGEAVLAVSENDYEVIVETRAGQFSFYKNELFHESCLRCSHRNPISADVIIGQPVPETDQNLANSAVEMFDAQAVEERYASFQKEAERCIRCYACREACPMCYCTECFVDHIEPRWTESGATPAGMQGWHIVRAFHQTGRCTDCGACERACPMDIKMTYLTEKLNYDMRNKYNFVTGLDIETQPPFATVTLDDKNRFTV